MPQSCEMKDDGWRVGKKDWRLIYLQATNAKIVYLFHLPKSSVIYNLRAPFLMGKLCLSNEKI